MRPNGQSEEAYREAQRKYRAKIKSKNSLAYYYRRKAEGLCPKCGTPSGERVFCLKCRIRNADAPSVRSSSVKFLNHRDRALRRVLWERPWLKKDPDALAWVKEHLEVFVDRPGAMWDRTVLFCQFDPEGLDKLGWMHVEEEQNAE